MMRVRRHVALVGCLIATAAAACAPPASAPPPRATTAGLLAADTAWVSDVLYFGRSIRGGGTVADAEWEAFLGEVVTPLFPDGLTVWEAHGQWRETGGALEREDTRVVQVVHRPSPAADSALAHVAAEYRRRFRQQSVLRVRSRVEVGVLSRVCAGLPRAPRLRRGDAGPPPCVHGGNG